MKLAIILLALFVAVSHQQYFHRGFFGFPWMSPYVQQPNYLLNLNHLIGSRNMDRDTELEVAPMRNYLPAPTSYDNNIFQDTQSRFKGFRPFAQQPSTYNQQDEQQDAANGRFLFFSGSNTNRNNAFVRVATATVTSTCTAITFVTCIAFAAAVPICRRKRTALEHDLLGEDKDDSQFIIDSTRVQWVMPTDTPSLAGKRDGRQVGVDDVTSSKDDITNDQQLEEFTKGEDQRRRGRFLYFGDSVTTTLTSWSVLSTVITTSVPPGALACLPQGSVACPLPGK